MFVCYYRTMILFCTVLFYFSFESFLFSSPASRFWTSSLPSAASTSNSHFRLPGFGLLPCLTLLQRPIHASDFPVLDFFRAFRYSNVQFPLPIPQFWTSSVPLSASTSNPRLRLPGFGLPPFLSLLQRPIHAFSFPLTS